MKIYVNGEIRAHDVMASNGYNKVDASEIQNWKEVKDRIHSNGIRATCSTFFMKDNRFFLFDGWESDQYGRMVKNPKYIEIVEVTEYLQ